MEFLDEDLSTLKKKLNDQINELNSQNHLLKQRADYIKQVLSTFKISIMFDDQLIMKQNEVDKLNELLMKLSDTLISTSKTEIEVN